MNDELDNNLQGSGRGLIDPLTWIYPGGTDKHHKKLQPRQLVLFEIRTKSRTEIYSVTATLACSAG
jgi:hypothetical protein